MTDEELTGAQPVSKSPVSKSPASKPLAASERFTFPKEARLRKRSEFLRVQNAGQKLNGDCVLALVLPNQRADQLTRLGLTVSSKVGNAVTRNRIRRRLRELFRLRRSSFPRGLDVVLIARSNAATAEWKTFVQAFDRLTKELHRRFKA